MRRRRRALKTNAKTEFDLDLAPLLAVMVKLVPVLLLSSAFVQVMMIETDLPQIVKEAIEQNREQKNTAEVQIVFSKRQGVNVRVSDQGRSNLFPVPMAKNGEFDYATLHQKLIEIKQAHPGVFRIELRPATDVRFDEIVRFMDEARKTRDPSKRFIIPATEGDEVKTTDYMFPDAYFGNALGEG